MESGSTSSWIGLIVLIALQGFLSAARTAIVNVRKTRLKQLQEEGNSTAALVERLAEDSTRFVATADVAATFINMLAATLAALAFAMPLAGLIRQVDWLAPAAGWLAVLGVIFALGLVMLTFGQLLPSLVGLQHTERLALGLARPMALLGLLTWPVVRLVVGAAHLLAGRPGSSGEASMPLITEEEIKTMVDAGEEGGAIEEEEKEMIYSIFKLGDTLVREIMVPRIDIMAVDAGSPVLQVLDMIMGAGHSRVPVYRESIDNIIGILHVKDLLPYLGRCEAAMPVEKVMLREPYFIPETKKADDLLPELQSRKVHMAIVVDEYGGTAGLVTIEDLLEEIVGEIQDEYDTEEPDYEKISEDEYILKGRINLDDLAELLRLELPEEEADTLGGFIYKRLGRVPSEGDVVEYDALRMEVLSVIGRRIDTVRITRQMPLAVTSEAAGNGRASTEE